MSGNILIKNGTLIDAEAILKVADIRIKDGIIADVADTEDSLKGLKSLEILKNTPILTALEKFEVSANVLESEEGETVIDAGGKVVMPSFADMHVHLRDPGFPLKETLDTGIKAAVEGGFTHIIAMANTNPVVDNPEIISDIVARAKALGLAFVSQCSAVTKGMRGEELVDFASMRRFTRFFSDDGKNINNPDVFAKALAASKEYDALILDHSEPEYEMLARNLNILEKVGGNLHLCHVSRKDSMQAVIKAKDKGLNVTVEVTPHHLFGYGLEYKVNPPFATKEDVAFLIKAIKDGYVDCISTDHAPHTAEDKAKGACGISGIEVAFGIVNRVFIENGISLHQLSKLVSFNPMRIMGFETPALIRKGNDANLVIADVKSTCEINPQNFVSKGKNTPFAGQKIVGKIIHTIRKGRLLK